MKIRRSDFDTAFEKANQKFIDRFTSDEITKRMSEFVDDNDSIDQTQLILFLHSESVANTREYLYDVLDSLFEIEEDS